MEQERSSRRRYKAGQEFYYDFTYTSECQRSGILAGDFQVGEVDSLLDARERRAQLLQEELEDADTVQKRSKQTAFNKGQRWVEDERSRENRLTIEAHIDVVRLEIQKLQQAITEAEKEKEKHDDLPCLPRGPEGMNQVRGSTGTGFVDGQWVEPVNGIPVIIDKRPTPYRGMSVMDYIEHVARPYLRASREHNAKRRKEEIEAGKKGESLPRVYPLPWPEWPANVKNHLNGQVKLQPSSGPKMVRKRS